MRLRGKYGEIDTRYGDTRRELPTRPTGARLRSGETLLGGPHRDLRARRETQLGQRRCDVALHGPLADTERSRDQAVGFPLRDECRCISLATGESAIGCLCRLPGRAFRCWRSYGIDV